MKTEDVTMNITVQVERWKKWRVHFTQSCEMPKSEGLFRVFPNCSLGLLQ